jgi:predicted nucleotidyltransferase
MVSEELLQQAVQRLVERFHPERIILFGSQARGDADPRSDVDLLVVCPYEGRQIDAMRELERAVGHLPLALDLIPVRPDAYRLERRYVNTLSAIADREGRVLYASG